MLNSGFHGPRFVVYKYQSRYGVYNLQEGDFLEPDETKVTITPSPGFSPGPHFLVFPKGTTRDVNLFNGEVIAEFKSLTRARQEARNLRKIAAIMES
jgi:hypothetical protein